MRNVIYIVVALELLIAIILYFTLTDIIITINRFVIEVFIPEKFTMYIHSCNTGELECFYARLISEAFFFVMLCTFGLILSLLIILISLLIPIVIGFVLSKNNQKIKNK